MNQQHKELIELVERNSPNNDQYKFFELFLVYIKSLTSNDFTFDGEGSYFGNQITVCQKLRFGGISLLDFEVAYDDNQIVVYTANHHGFYVRPYCCIKNDDSRFNVFLKEFKNTIASKFGLL